MSTAKNELLDQVYSARSDAELEAGYDGWAEAYDGDLVSFGYRLPTIVSGLFGRYVRPDDGPVLDAGVGTGLVGESLALLGYGPLTGIDLSPGMLKAAERKKVYEALRQMRLGGPLDFPGGHFAATTAVGVLTTGHAKADSFDELIRVTRSGGHMIFSVRVDGDAGAPFLARQEALEEAGSWQRLHATEAFQSMPLGEPEVFHQVFVYQIR